MAKRRRSAAQRAATRKMIAARKRQLRGGGKRRRRRRRARRPSVALVVRKRRRRARRNPTALVVNPGGHMAKRRRRRRKGSSRRRRHARRALARHNPRHVRRHRRRRHRRNPGLMGGLKASLFSTLGGAVPAVAGGALANVIDAKALGDKHMVIRLGAKVLEATVLGLALRRFFGERAGLAAMYGVLGTMGGELGLRLAGGIVAPTAKQAAKSLKALADEDEAMLGVLAEEGIGVLQLGDGGDDDDDDAFSGDGESDANELPDPSVDGLGEDYGEDEAFS